MPEACEPIADYLTGLSGNLTGSRNARQRLLAEINDHLDDAVAANLERGLRPAEAERLALEELGSLETLLDAWRIRCARRDRRTRRQLAATIAATSVTVLLAVAQHAQGGHTPSAPAASGKPSATECEHSWNEHASIAQRQAVHELHRALVVPEARRTVHVLNRSGVVTFPESCAILFYRDASTFRTVILSTQGAFHLGAVTHWQIFSRRIGDTPPGNAVVRSDGTIAGQD